MDAGGVVVWQERAAAAAALAAMANFLGQPFMGPASVPHANPDFFKVYFAGAHVSSSVCILHCT